MVTRFTLSFEVLAPTDGAALLTAFQTDLAALTLDAVVTDRKAGRILPITNLDQDTTTPDTIYVNVTTDGTQTPAQVDAFELAIRTQYNTTLSNL